jgi:hypothetical protein
MHDGHVCVNLVDCLVQREQVNADAVQSKTPADFAEYKCVILHVLQNLIADDDLLVPPAPWSVFIQKLNRAR